MTAPIAGTGTSSLRVEALLAARNALLTHILARCGTKAENIAHLLKAESVLESLPIQLEDIGAAIDRAATAPPSDCRSTFHTRSTAYSGRFSVCARPSNRPPRLCRQ